MPPVYGAVAEKVLVRAPRTGAIVTPAEYGTVRETVVVEPARRIWTVRRDAWGHKIGCWVETPARYGTVTRRVMVRAPEVVPYAQAAIYGTRLQSVQVAPAHAEWVPIAE